MNLTLSSCTLNHVTPPSSHTDQSDVRRLVLDAAIDIITNDGVEHVSMREVARRAGISHQAPYHYFGDRAGIFAAISEEGFLGLSDALHRADSSSTNAARDGLRAYLTFAMSHRGHFRVMFRNDICGISSHESTLLAADQAFNALLSVVNRVVDGELNEGDTMVWATTLWSIAHGLATLVIDGPLMPRLAKQPGMDDTDVFLESVLDQFDTMVKQQARTLFTT